MVIGLFIFWMKKLRNRERDEHCKNLQTTQDHWVCPAPGVSPRANPGRQMCDKSQGRPWYLSENTRSVKDKFSFHYQNKQKSCPLTLSFPACSRDSEHRAENARGTATSSAGGGWERQPADQSLRALHIHISRLFSTRKFWQWARDNTSSLCGAGEGGLLFSSSPCRTEASPQKASPLQLNERLHTEVFDITHKVFEGLSKESSESLTMNKNDFTCHLCGTFYFMGLISLIELNS